MNRGFISMVVIVMWLPQLCQALRTWPWMPLSTTKIMLGIWISWTRFFLQLSWTRFFSPADINEILHTPTPSFKSEDTCIWAETKDGLYSVKGAYHMIMNNFVNQETWCVNGEWKILWDMKIPPRVKLMIWRSCRGTVVLAQEIIYVVGEFNVLLFVHFVKQVLKPLLTFYSPVQWTVSVGRLSKWIQKCCNVWILQILLANFMRVLDDPQQARASMLIWNLWKRRNGKVWDNTSSTSQSVVHQYDIFYQVWIRAQENNNHQRSSSVHQHHHQQVSSWFVQVQHSCSFLRWS